MNNLFFWREFRLPHRILYSLLGLVFLASLGFFAYAWVLGAEQLYGWETEGGVEVLPVAVDEFSTDFFTFRIDVDHYLITQRFLAGSLPLQQNAMYIMFAFVLVGLVAYLTAATYIRKGYLFAIAMAGGALFFMAAQFSQLSAPLSDFQSADPSQYFLMVCLLLVLGVGYVFQSFLVRTSLLARVLAFSLLIGGIGYYFMTEYAQVQNPVFALGNFMMYAPFAFTVIFIVFNAHEIPHTFTYLVTNAGKLGNNFRHFIIAFVFYFINLIYAYAVTSRYVDGDLLYFSPFLLYFITTILSVWGFRKREDRFAYLINFRPYGAILFLAMAIISNATIAYAIVTDNTPLIETFQELIIYAHIGMAIGFLGYVFTNFANQLQFNYQIHKIIWKPRRLDYIFFVGLGMMVMTIFMTMSDFFITNQIQAGYFNGLADVFKEEKIPYLAKRYYEKSLGYDYQSRKANYELALLHKAENDHVNSSFFFEQAQLKTPLPQTYAQLTEERLLLNQLTDAIAALELGLEKFPRNGALRNNLGLLYEQAGREEDAKRAFALAEKYSYKPEIPEANRFALLSGASKVDSIPENTKISPAILSNQLVGLSRQNVSTERDFDPTLFQDSVLETPEMCYLIHHAFNQLSKNDPSIAASLADYARLPENTPQQLFLNTAESMQRYANGDTREAYLLMNYLRKSQGAQSSNFANVLGYWLLEHEQYRESVIRFEESLRGGRKTGQLERALALTEFSNKASARLTWQVWALTKNHPYQELAKDMLKVFDWNKTEATPDEWTDNDRYRLLYYFTDSLENTVFDEEITKIKSTDLQVRALARRVEHQIQRKDSAAVQTNLAAIAPILPQQPKSLEYKLRAQLQGYAFLGNTKKMQELLPDFQPTRALTGWKSLFEAQVAIARKDSTQAAQMLKESVRALPFELETYRTGIEFYRQEGNPTEAYNYALAGVEVLSDNTEMLKIYAIESLRAGFERYAENSVDNLRAKLPEEQFEAFLVIYEREKEKIAAAYEAWLNGE